MKPTGIGTIDIKALRKSSVLNATDAMEVEREGEHKEGVYNYIDIVITGEPKASELRAILQDERRIAIIKANEWDGPGGEVHRDLGLRFHIKNCAVINEDFYKYVASLDDRILRSSFASGYNITKEHNCQFFILLANVSKEELGIGKIVTTNCDGSPFLDRVAVEGLAPVKSESTEGYETLLGYQCRPEHMFRALEPVKHLLDYTRFDEVMFMKTGDSNLGPFVLDTYNENVNGYIQHDKVPTVALSASVLSKVIGDFENIEDCFSVFSVQSFEPSEEATTIKTLLLGGIEVIYKTTKVYDGTTVVIIIQIK